MKITIKNSTIKKRILQPLNSFRLYWVAYGGWTALFCSLYLWTSVIISICICYLNSDLPEKWSWTEAVRNIVPSVLGFSLGGYAMLVGFGDEKFLNALRSKGEAEKASPYMKVNASFLHFIFIQFLCILFSTIAEAVNLKNNICIYFIGTTLFFYSLFTIISTAFAVLNLADWFDCLYMIDNEDENKSDDKKE